MTFSELNEDKQDQISDLLENLMQIERLIIKDIRILLYKIVRKYGGKVVNKFFSLFCLFISILFILERFEFIIQNSSVTKNIFMFFQLVPLLILC